MERKSKEVELCEECYEPVTAPVIEVWNGIDLTFCSEKCRADSHR